METKKRSILVLTFYTFNTILLIFWGIFLFWLIKRDLIWNPLQFFVVFIPLIFLAYIPIVLFIRTIIRIAKNLTSRFIMPKKQIAASLLICFLVWSFSLLMLLLFVLPSAALFQVDDITNEIDDIKGPYLTWNDDSKTSITISWITPNPTKTQIEYGTSLDKMNQWENELLTKRHVVDLKNLKSATRYYYRIAENVDQIYNFNTAPSDAIPFHFVALSDTHAGSASSKYGNIIDAMNPYSYDFILHAGDVAGQEGDDLEGWHYFFNLMERHATNRPYMIAIGNHEYGELDLFGRNFKYYFPYDYVESWGHYYSFDYSNAHFIMLDVFQNQLEWGGFLLETQEAWLRKDLAENQNKWLFVVLHASPYSTGHYNMNHKLITQLTPIFYEYQVDVVLSGHDHHYEAFWTNRTEAWGGTYYFVMGGGGGGLDISIMNRETNPWKREYHRASIFPYQNDYVTLHDQLYGEITHHFLHFEVSGSSLYIQAIRIDGTLIQEFELKK